MVHSSVRSSVGGKVLKYPAYVYFRFRFFRFFQSPTLPIFPRMQSYDVPASGIYKITTRGANSCDGASKKGGCGAIVTASFKLKKGDHLDLLCGAHGPPYHYY